MTRMVRPNDPSYPANSIPVVILGDPGACPEPISLAPETSLAFAGVATGANTVPERTNGGGGLAGSGDAGRSSFSSAQPDPSSAATYGGFVDNRLPPTADRSLYEQLRPYDIPLSASTGSVPGGGNYLSQPGRASYSDLGIGVDSRFLSPRGLEAMQQRGGLDAYASAGGFAQGSLHSGAPSTALYGSTPGATGLYNSTPASYMANDPITRSASGQSGASSYAQASANFSAASANYAQASAAGFPLGPGGSLLNSLYGSSESRQRAVETLVDRGIRPAAVTAGGGGGASGGYSTEYVRRLEDEMQSLRRRMDADLQQRDETATQFRLTSQRLSELSEVNARLEQALAATYANPENLMNLKAALAEERSAREEGAKDRDRLQAQVGELEVMVQAGLAEIVRQQEVLEAQNVQAQEQQQQLEQQQAEAAALQDQCARLQGAIDTASERAATEREWEKERRREDVEAAEARSAKALEAAQAARDAEVQRLRDELLAVSDGAKKKSEETAAERERMRRDTDEELRAARAESEQLVRGAREEARLDAQRDWSDKVSRLEERAEALQDKLQAKVDASAAERNHLMDEVASAQRKAEETWEHCQELRQQLQTVMRDLADAGKKLGEFERTKRRSTEVMEELKRALAESTDLNEAAKEELEYLRGRVAELQAGAGARGGAGLRVPTPDSLASGHMDFSLGEAQMPELSLSQARDHRHEVQM